MNRFNLTFKGDILPGHDPARVKSRFGKLFSIDDPERIERFFTGQTIILRRNLDRKVAAEYFQKLRQLGVEAELVKVTAAEATERITRTPPPTPTPDQDHGKKTEKPSDSASKHRGMDRDILQRRPGQVDQSWAVSSGARQTTADQAEQKRKETEQAAQRAAKLAEEKRRETEEAEHKAAEEAARRAAELAEKQRREAEEATRQKALREEAERKAAEEAAQRAAELAEKQRREAEEAARQKALREEAERKAAEEAARRAAELAEKQRREAEEAARQKALREEAERKAAEEAKRKAAEEAERRAAELAEKQRREAEETARLKALREEAERKVAEEAARRAAELAEQKRREAEEAKRKAAEEAARRAAELAEKKRRAAEEAARQKALREEARRKAAEEAALRAAELAEKKRRKAEEAARQKALREEAKRKAAEEAAQRAAELAERKRRRAEEAARQKALREEAKRKAAQEAEQRKAELAEQKRKNAEEAARQKALREETRRKAAAEVARQRQEQAERKHRQAELAAQQKAQEQARLKAARAEEAARQKALHDEARREAASVKAARKAEQDALARKQAEQLARQKAEQQKEEAQRRAVAAAQREEKLRRQREKQEAQQRLQQEQSASLKAARAEKKRQRTQEQAELRAREQQRKAQQQAEAQALLAEQTAQREAMEEQAVSRAASELAQQPALKPVKARVKTRLDLPLRKQSHGHHESGQTRRKRQPGEPNLFSLRPFRNTPEVRERAARAGKRMRVDFTIASIALLGLLALLATFVTRPPAHTVSGASAVAIDASGGPLLLAGEQLLLHDRSGAGSETVTLDSLGLSELQPPMAFNEQGLLFALGNIKTGRNVDVAGPALLQCDLARKQCVAFSGQLAGHTVSAFVIHPLDGTLLIADAEAGQLLRLNSDGKLLASAAIELPDHVVMRLQSGLLFMNSALGTGISVFRYDDSAFGKQLDEILLMPPAALQAGQSTVLDFVPVADSWWASLHNPESGLAGLYRFDSQWGFREQAQLSAGFRPQQLISWVQKILVNDPRQKAIQRFNAAGKVEAPLQSDSLLALTGRQQRHAFISALAWRFGLLFATLATGIFFGRVYIQRLRQLVYKPQRQRGANPVDEFADEISWITHNPQRERLLGRAIILYAGLSAAALLLAATLDVAAAQLTALLLALCGPALALLLLRRSPPGHIGVWGKQLLLVDHAGTYHLGGGPLLQYRGSFLLLDDVVVFTGGGPVQAFSGEQLQEQVTPVARQGIKVDRNTVLVKLLQSRHPLVLGLAASLAGLCAAIALLYLQGIF